MSFPRYPKYKDSGVEWLGEVPEGWEVGPMKRHILKVESGTSVNASDQPADGGKPGVLKTSCVYSGTFNPEENKTVVEEDIARVSCPLTAGTIIVSRMNTPDLVGAAGLVETAPDNLYLPDRLWQISFKNCDARFVHFWTLTGLYRAQVESVCTGTSASMKNLGQDQFALFSFPSPPIDEQARIAGFLGREIGKIDELVAEQRRLMELLKEKRQAVISHAVTKGLNPRAPMKPSNIEWLGDVPEHWEVKPLKHAITKIEQGWSPQCESEPAANDEWGVLKVGCGNRDTFDATEQKALPLDVAPMPEYEIKPGDILMSRGNTLELVGSATFIESVRPRLLLCDLLYRFRARPERAEGKFLVLSLRSPHVRFQIEREATGTSASMKKIGQGTIRELVIALPPPDEQRAIIQFVMAETTKLDALAAEAQKAIDLLQERRTALISAAVTGQIDVRKLAAA
jgi:type I restriction enzyme S subunit